MSFLLHKKIYIFLGIASAVFFLVVPAAVFSVGHIDELKNKISGKSAEIQQIEKEIAGFEKEIVVLEGESDTLSNSIGKLDVTRKKIGADISVTQRQIEKADLSIEELGLEIEEKANRIGEARAAIVSIIREMNERESNSLVEVLLSQDSFATFLGEIETLAQFGRVMDKNAKDLTVLKGQLQGFKVKEEVQQDNLVGYRTDLRSQKKIVDNNRSEKNQLLSVTKNKESGYRKLVTEKEQQKAEFEKELLEIESQLRIAIDPESIPTPRAGFFGKPLASANYVSCYRGGIGNCVTQFFGDTPFAKSGAYNGQTHNGMDFRARTPQKALSVLPGTVVEVGNTDAIPGCLSYGKWALVDHGNGLTTLYAHMSLISVQAGQTLSAGDAVGYTGNTGYSTGPHLHLTVYASQGVEVVRLGDIPGRPTTKCSPARIPIAPFNAYLSPLDYL